jgi:signal transduction histidine kinase
LGTIASMPQEELFLFYRHPSRGQVKAVSVVALIVLLAFLLTLPFRRYPLPQLHAFMPIVDTILALGDLLTATLFFMQASVLRSRALIALGTGYFFTGIMIIPHGLTFPEAFSPTGLLGAGVDTTIWLYIFWHTGFPVAVITYAVLKKADAEATMRRGPVRRAIFFCIAASILLVTGLTLLATIGQSLLPKLMTDRIYWDWQRSNVAALSLMVLMITAVVMILKSRKSILDMWLLLALWAWMIELLLVLLTSSRFSGAWYTGRIAGLLSVLFILTMLIAETTRLYARLALSLTQQQRERESRMITVNAVTASIAHEVKQPLAAIVANATIALEGLKPMAPELNEIAASLNAIVEESSDAAKIVDNVRAMFQQGDSEKNPLNMNELIRDTVGMMAGELQAHRISLQLALDEKLPVVVADRLRMQHVLLNLFVNAVEAMTPIHDRQHLLFVQTSPCDDFCVLIKVEDTGSGISPDNAGKIFEAFFTTKTHGTGVGLALCRSIVQSHGGTLRASPRVPYGSIFQIQLPRAERETEESLVAQV